MKFEEYVGHDAMGLAELIKKKEVKPTELLALAFARANEVNPMLNAIVARMDDEALEQAASGAGGPFQGVPFLIKDLLADLAGHPTSNGSELFKDLIAEHDSELVRRFKKAGLLIFGKTNSPELGLTPFTEPRLFGPSKNPWALDRTPGGSSGGSASAVAAGIVPIASGGDGGGSIRIPASCTGLVGFKPSRGLIPTGPDRIDSWWGFATEHVLTRTVRDTAAALDATAGPDAGCHSYTTPAQSYLSELEHEPPRLRIAYSADPLIGRIMHEDCQDGLDLTAQLLHECGHELVEDRPPLDGELFALCYTMLIAGQVAASLRTGAEVTGKRVSRQTVEPETLLMATAGEKLSAADLSWAWNTLGTMTRQIGQWFENYDIFVTPTLGRPPFRIGELQANALESAAIRVLTTLPVGKNITKTRAALLKSSERIFDWIPNTPVFNVTGQPSVSLPLHWNGQRLPVGMMFTAPFNDDVRLLQLSRQMELARPWFHRRAPL